MPSRNNVSRSPNELHCAVLTPGGRGAVATVEFYGPPKLLSDCFTAGNGRNLAEQSIGRVVFGRWEGPVAEDVVLCRTSPTRIEIHCHGGDAAVRRILADLEARGVRAWSWQEAVQALYGEFEAEWTAAVAQATTRRTADILLQQRTAFPVALHRADDRESIDELLRWADFGLKLTEPWRVVLFGRPNVGKSSLVNALVGYDRSVVFDRPGTTRDVVTAETAFDGWPMQFADTAGLRDTGEELEAAGIARARQTLAAADVRVLVFDVSQPPDAEAELLRREFPDAVRVAHKCDLPIRWSEEQLRGTVAVSSRTGEGIAELVRDLVVRAVPRVPPPHTAVPFTRRQGELLTQAREALRSADRDGFRRLLDAV